MGDNPKMKKQKDSTSDLYGKDDKKLAVRTRPLKVLRVTKEDVRGAYQYYGLFYSDQDRVISKLFVVKRDKPGEQLLCYDFAKENWVTRNRNAFYERLNASGFSGEISALSEADALWFLEQHQAFNGEGDDAAVEAVLAKWAEKLGEYKAAFDYGWPAKYVETTFYLKGKMYSIKPDSIGLKTGNSWDEGLLEYMQTDIGKDLKEIGATEIRHMGFLD